MQMASLIIAEILWMNNTIYEAKFTKTWIIYTMYKQQHMMSCWICNSWSWTFRIPIMQLSTKQINHCGLQ